MDRETINILTDLLTGRLEIDEFKQQLGDMLFELRQDATPSEDKTMLARIQLYIHEFDEGNRDLHEVYMAAQAALDLAKPNRRPVPIVVDRVINYPVKPSEVRTTTASAAPELTELAEIPL
jgi:hypothetical protein